MIDFKRSSNVWLTFNISPMHILSAWVTLSTVLTLNAFTSLLSLFTLLLTLYTTSQRYSQLAYAHNIFSNFRHGIDNAKFTRKKHDTKIKCLKCSTEFKSVLELNDHEVLAHCTGSEAKNFSCNQCDLVWTSGHVLTLHIKVDHGMTEVNPCDICGKILKSKHSLDSHKKVDHQGGIKDHICHLCGRGFFRPVALKDHIIRIHEGSGKYFCDRCPFKAMCKKELEIHINACHTKAVKFQCLQCSYSGFRESALGTHIRTVHQNYKPNKCDLCDMAFVAKRDLKKHKENKH
jgi:hypothetical protein